MSLSLLNQSTAFLNNTANLSLLESSKLLQQDTVNNIILWYVIIVLLNFAGAANNILLLIVICKQQRLRNGAGILIGHIIIIVSVLCLVLLPISSTAILLQVHGYELPIYFCRYIQTLVGTCVVAGNWADFFLGLNRFVAICFPHHYAPWTRRRLIFIFITMTWLLALIMKGLNFVGIGGDYVATELGMCVYVGGGQLGNAMLALGGWVPYVLVGLIAVAILVRSIINSLKHQHRRTALSLHVKRRLSVAKMLFVSFLFGFICNLPVSILMSNVQFVAQINPLTALWLRFLFVGPLALNPIIFYAMNEDYRAGFFAIFRSLRCHISKKNEAALKSMKPSASGNTSAPIIEYVASNNNW